MREIRREGRITKSTFMQRRTLTETVDYIPETLTELSSRSTASDETFHKIEAWLRDCNSHKVCTKSSIWRSKNAGTMPTRLLKLANGDAAYGVGNPHARLVHTAQLPIQSFSR